MSRSFSLFHHPTQQLEDVKFFLVVLMTLIASIITFSKKKKFGKKNVTLDPRHGTLALDMEPSTLDPRQKDRLNFICTSLRRSEIPLPEKWRSGKQTWLITDQAGTSRVRQRVKFGSQGDQIGTDNLFQPSKQTWGLVWFISRQENIASRGMHDKRAPKDVCGEASWGPAACYSMIWLACIFQVRLARLRQEATMKNQFYLK